nr:MAG TPA: hypothetical protein [Caudoviricetes sp.]
MPVYISTTIRQYVYVFFGINLIRYYIISLCIWLLSLSQKCELWKASRKLLTNICFYLTQKNTGTIFF